MGHCRGVLDRLRRPGPPPPPSRRRRARCSWPPTAASPSGCSCGGSPPGRRSRRSPGRPSSALISTTDAGPADDTPARRGDHAARAPAQDRALRRREAALLDEWLGRLQTPLACGRQPARRHQYLSRAPTRRAAPDREETPMPGAPAASRSFVLRRLGGIGAAVAGASPRRTGRRPHHADKPREGRRPDPRRSIHRQPQAIAVGGATCSTRSR